MARISASPVMVGGAPTSIAIRMFSCVARNPVGRSASSKNAVTTRDAWRRFMTAQAATARR